MAYWASYIAFGLDKNESEELLAELQNMLSQYEDFIAWHNPEYMHMTLHFLGWIKDTDIDKLKNILYEEKSNIINFKLDGKLMLLGFDKEKEYIATRVKLTDDLVQYREKLAIRMQEQGISFKKQDFLSHISLGRVHHLNEIEDKEYFRPRVLQTKGVYVFASVSESSVLVGERV